MTMYRGSDNSPSSEYREHSYITSQPWPLNLPICQVVQRLHQSHSQQNIHQPQVPNITLTTLKMANPRPRWTAEDAQRLELDRAHRMEVIRVREEAMAAQVRQQLEATQRGIQAELEQQRVRAAAQARSQELLKQERLELQRWQRQQDRERRNREQQAEEAESERRAQHRADFNALMYSGALSVAGGSGSGGGLLGGAGLGLGYGGLGGGIGGGHGYGGLGLGGVSSVMDRRLYGHPY
jgi:hypothetical protein